MKTIRKNKPDLLVVLAVFVGLGVLMSIYTESMSPTANAESVSEDTKSSPSHADKKAYNDDFIKVTIQNSNTSLPKEQR